jgi:predicted phosphodiesterase
MKIISYSDLHLEFGTGFLPPAESDADVMILAGDIITFRDYKPLQRFLAEWSKPVLFVAGNHEYYTNTPMQEEDARFKAWLAEAHPNATFLQDQAITIDGVHFFGGTMWTDFNGRNEKAMLEALANMNDYRLIKMSAEQRLTPAHTADIHAAFVRNISRWFEEDLEGPRVVITHHAPAVNPNTKYGNSLLMPAFNSLDMLALIDKHQPALWVYGHTHECDNQSRGKTQIISNQLGYPNRAGGFECQSFDRAGLPITL